MKVLVTGSAGFIGSAVCIRILARGDTVIGIDNHNDYYDTSLKEARLTRHMNCENYSHLKMDLSDSAHVAQIFSEHRFDSVIHLAAQAGVRHSLENPLSYINSNLLGFANVLEGCRHQQIQHLVYASSSSVYGANTAVPFSTSDNVDHPLSLYAATKKSNELMAHSYSHLYGIPTTGLRFFTVYGPWGRPDMALFKFTKAILEKRPIPIYNFGKHKRDFTYIDDIVEGIIRLLDKPATANLDWDAADPDPQSSNAPWRIYNIGNSKSVELLRYIDAIEKSLGMKANREFLPKQPGDVEETFADIRDLINQTGYAPKTDIDEGIENFVDWFKDYYGY